MHLDGIILVEDDKIYKYLLVPRKRDDKSKLLGLLGFTKENGEALRAALIELAMTGDAVLDRTDRHGLSYRIVGELIGPTGAREFITIWMDRTEESNTYRFVTLKPVRG